eukprot:scaffold88678_cov31-Tisochrysis_lutea.AAC.3
MLLVPTRTKSRHNQKGRAVCGAHIPSVDGLLQVTRKRCLVLPPCGHYALTRTCRARLPVVAVKDLAVVGEVAHNAEYYGASHCSCTFVMIYVSTVTPDNSSSARVM